MILGHISVTDSRERWGGGGKQTNSDHSIFPYTVDGYRCDSVLLVWRPLVWQGDHCKRTTDQKRYSSILLKHTVFALYCELTVKQNARDDHSLPINGIVWKTTTSSSPLFTLFIFYFFLGGVGRKKTNKPLAGWGHSRAVRKQEVMLFLFFCCCWTDLKKERLKNRNKKKNVKEEPQALNPNSSIQVNLKQYDQAMRRGAELTEQ